MQHLRTVMVEDGGGRPGNGNNGKKSPNGGRCASLRRDPEGGRAPPTKI
jgi:hypothetical protein